MTVSASGLRRYGACAGLSVLLLAPADGHAERLSNQIAVFSALDKVTARISRIEVPLNETHRFGSLKVTPRVCYSRPPTERPKTTTFVEVDEVMLNGTEKRLFSGWMFAESPGLNAVEHPVFDVWLIGCRRNERSAAAARAGGEMQAAPAAPAPPPRRRRRRVRR